MMSLLYCHLPCNVSFLCCYNVFPYHHNPPITIEAHWFSWDLIHLGLWYWLPANHFLLIPQVKPSDGHLFIKCGGSYCIWTTQGARCQCSDMRNIRLTCPFPNAMAQCIYNCRRWIGIPEGIFQGFKGSFLAIFCSFVTASKSMPDCLFLLLTNRAGVRSAIIQMVLSVSIH